jgi:hypothetical protein
MRRIAPGINRAGYKDNIAGLQFYYIIIVQGSGYSVFGSH